MKKLEVRKSELLPLISLIYDAALDVTKWDEALESMARIFNSTGAQVSYFDQVHAEFSFLAYWGFSSSFEDKFKKMTFEDDPRASFLLKNPNKTLTCRQTCSETVLHNSKIYKDVLKPCGIEYSMAIYFDEINSSFGCTRSIERSAFDKNDCALFSELIPHFRRAVQIHTNFAQLNFHKHIAASVLDAIPIAIMVVDKAGLALHCNNAMKIILSKDDGLSLMPNGQIWLNNKNSRQELRDAISSIISKVVAGDENAPGQAVSLPRSSSDKPLLAIVAPLWVNIKRYGINRTDNPLAAIFLSDPLRPPETPIEALQRLFGLTFAEAKVLKEMVSGQTIEEIAGALDISHNTVRTHLKRLFEKTNTNRQPDLVKVVLSSPVWIAATTEIL